MFGWCFVYTCDLSSFFFFLLFVVTICSCLACSNLIQQCVIYNFDFIFSRFLVDSCVSVYMLPVAFVHLQLLLFFFIYSGHEQNVFYIVWIPEYKQTKIEEEKFNEKGLQFSFFVFLFTLFLEITTEFYTNMCALLLFRSLYSFSFKIFNRNGWDFIKSMLFRRCIFTLTYTCVTHTFT